MARIDHKNNYKNCHKSKYNKKQMIICINNVVLQMKKYETSEFSRSFL